MGTWILFSTFDHFCTMADSGKDVPPSTSQRVPTTHRDFFFEDPHFKENWHNFDKIRDSVFKESRDLWKQMDQDFRKMRCMNPMLTAADDEEGKSAPLLKYEDSWMFPRKWMIPSFADNLKDHNLFDHDGDHEVIRFKEDDQHMEVSLDTSHYRPDELHVHADEKFITIEGKHVETSADGKKHLTRRFQRKYSLPAGAKAADVSSNLSSDGVLVVNAIKHEPVKEVEIKQVK